MIWPFVVHLIGAYGAGAIYPAAGDHKTLTPLSGLALVGKAIARFSQLRQLIDPRFPVRGGIPNSDVLIAYLGLLCQGKSDFDAIERFREDRFFSEGLGLRAVLSSPTVRQRLDTRAEEFLPLVDESLLQLVKWSKVPITPLSCGWVALDMDVFTLDNSDTRKESIGWTYAGFVGYAPPLRRIWGRRAGVSAWSCGKGTQHSAEATDATLDRVLPRALQLTHAPLLVRLDAGFHGKNFAQAIARYDATRRETSGAPVAFLVKWNRRGHDLEAIAQRRHAQADAVWGSPRPGKRVTVWEEDAHVGTVAVRRIFRLTERTILANGQRLLLPEMTLEGWDTTLPDSLDAQTVIALYADHATHEQFHAEIKTDLDLERLPSGTFATNDLVLTLGAMWPTTSCA